MSKNYHDFLLKLGYKQDWGEDTRNQYSNDKVLIDVCEQEDGHHEFAMCPKENFDRWANSRHINWRLMVENYKGHRQQDNSESQGSRRRRGDFWPSLTHLRHGHIVR